MLYRNFGKTCWQVGTVGLGTWNIGNQWGVVDEETAFATVRAAFNAGMNLFDYRGILWFAQWAFRRASGTSFDRNPASGLSRQ
ncbi:MAG: aldo/keto reductase [Candidatus Latescibacterota bacterium]|nr:aldo/keto reductase [Candidatus Latescibacterota bacterium]